jgi:hypothetical protein
MNQQERLYFVRRVIESAGQNQMGDISFRECEERVGRVIDEVFEIGKVAGAGELAKEIADGRKDDD